MENEFRRGQRVRHKGRGDLGTIKGATMNVMDIQDITLKLDNGTTFRTTSDEVELIEMPDEDEDEDESRTDAK